MVTRRAAVWLGGILVLTAAVAIMVEDAVDHELDPADGQGPVLLHPLDPGSSPTERFNRFVLGLAFSVCVVFWLAICGVRSGLGTGVFTSTGILAAGIESLQAHVPGNVSSLGDGIAFTGGALAILFFLGLGRGLAWLLLKSKRLASADREHARQGPSA